MPRAFCSVRSKSENHNEETRFGRTFQNGHAIFHPSSQRTVGARTALSLELVCVIGLPQTAQKVLDTISAQMSPIHSTGNLSRRIRPCWLDRSSRCVTVLSFDPPNRFERNHSEPDFEHLEWDEEALGKHQNRYFEYLSDNSKSIISENNSPDISFRYSLNPYRGRAH